VLTGGGQTISYLYDGTTPLLLNGPGGYSSFTNLPDSNETLVANTAVGAQIPIHDALGSVVGAVAGNGNLAYQYTYDPFGSITAAGSTTTRSSPANFSGAAFENSFGTPGASAMATWSYCF